MDELAAANLPTDIADIPKSGCEEKTGQAKTMSDDYRTYRAITHRRREDRLSQLLPIAWAILFGMFIVVLFGVLFSLHLQLDRIERNALIDDAYRSTVQALTNE